MTGAAASARIVTSGLLRDWPLPDPSGDKNSSGRVLVVGGNEHMPGAVLLSAEAAMRAGAGKLQLATVDSVTAALGVAIPEGYVLGLPTNEEGDLTPDGADDVLELAGKCDAVLMSKNGVDGVYDSDPRTNPDATKYDEITYEEALQRGLRVVDAAAFSLCMDNKLPMVVFGMEGEGNVAAAIRGERIGTVVSN